MNLMQVDFSKRLIELRIICLSVSAANFITDKTVRKLLSHFLTESGRYLVWYDCTWPLLTIELDGVPSLNAYH